MLLTDFRAHAGGDDWTEAFRGALEVLRDQGGGVLTVPPGRYRSHSIQLYSHITLDIQSGAVISFFEEMEGYSLIDMEFEGIPMKAAMPLLFADGAEDVRITGGGTLDGNGHLWWQAVRDGTLTLGRPYLVCFRRCRDVVLEGVTLLNSPVWTVHPLYCDNVSIRGITIRNPKDSPNTDGIDPNSCRNVRIMDCLIDVGDDCIAIKSGTEDTPERIPTENVLISHCQMLGGHGGVVIGSEMSGGVRNVQVSGCIFSGTDRGIRIKTRRLRGGMASNLSFSNLLMEDVLCPFVFNMYYFCGKGGRLPHVSHKGAMPVDEGTPAISDVRIAHVTALRARAAAGVAYGLMESPITRLTLSDITVTMTGGIPAQAAMMDGMEAMACAGFILRNARDVSFHNVRIEGAKGDPVDRDGTVTGTLDASIDAIATEMKGKTHEDTQTGC